MSNKQRKDYELGVMDDMWQTLRRHDAARRTRVLNWLKSKSDELHLEESGLKAPAPDSFASELPWDAVKNLGQSPTVSCR